MPFKSEENPSQSDYFGHEPLTLTMAAGGELFYRDFMTGEIRAILGSEDFEIDQLTVEHYRFIKNELRSIASQSHNNEVLVKALREGEEAIVQYARDHLIVEPDEEQQTKVLPLKTG